jgi:endoglucanase
MTNEEVKDLSALLACNGVSGSEESVTSAFSSLIKDSVDETHQDLMGNLLAVKKGNTSRKVLLMAHADEIGLMITYVDEKGFLYFKEIGGIDTNLLPGTRVIVMGLDSQPIEGVIGKKPLHLQEREEGKKEYEPEDLCIDAAFLNKEEALEKIEIGTVAFFPRNALFMPHDRVASSALDDRIGLYVLLQVAKRLAKESLNVNVYFVASVQEELGARGVYNAIEGIKPECGIVIDVTHATDYPGLSPVKHGDIQLGKGCTIALGPTLHRNLTSQLIRCAKEANIQYQVEPLARPTGTDANPMQLSGLGIQTGLVSIPCRYMHTPNEIVSLEDAETAVSLLESYLKSYR